jgi:serine/threonine protein kinase
MEETLPLPDQPTLPELTGPARKALSDRYEIQGEVGRGGMGVVYRATHRTLQVPVAIKVSLPGAQTPRFLREARLLAQVHSPHVVRVHDCDTLPDGFPFLVMEWVDGDLAKIMKRQGGAIDEAKALTWMRQTCEGMRHAAGLGIVHRDLKPSNILVDASGAARVADFGLARGSVGGDLARTSDDTTMGTPLYMAPEQAEDPHNVDTRADVYSFGATFYHALTGSPPFRGSTAFAVLFQHKTEPIVSPRARCPQLSQRTSEIIERCLAKSPGDRFSSFEELQRQLNPVPQQASPWDATDDAELAPYLARYQSRRDGYLWPGSAGPATDSYPFPGGKVLRIIQGSITSQQVDAIVSSDDEQLSMGGGVSAAIRRMGGVRLAHEAQRYVPVRRGRAVVTSGGDLSVRFVFHGVSLDYARQDWVMSRDVIIEILSSCIYHADTLDVKSIAFPLFGTGVGGFSRIVCLDTMFRFLARTLLRGVTSVQEARIVLFDVGHHPLT